MASEVAHSRDEQIAKPHLDRNAIVRTLGQRSDVCFTPKSGHVQRTSPCPLCANSGH